MATLETREGLAPFHVGERALQTRAGSREWLEEVGSRVMRRAMPDQHRVFFEQLPFVALGVVDDSGQPQATLLAGPGAGFIRSPNDTHLQIAALPADDDPVAAALRPGARVGLLGIELQTRRRNRANGRVERLDGSGFTLHVEQSFGNCPKYIQRRDRLPGAAPVPGAPVPSTQLDSLTKAFVEAADTFFIASHGGGDAVNNGADVSHRGGRPGFVRVSDDGRTLTWPDYQGNSFFNTLGNLAVESRAALVIPDFGRGDLLHLNGRAEIVWDGPAVAAFAGAERLVRLHIDEVLLRPGALPLRWQLRDLSPVLP